MDYWSMLVVAPIVVRRQMVRPPVLAPVLTKSYQIAQHDEICPHGYYS